jgi:hypothetical protein
VRIVAQLLSQLLHEARLAHPCLPAQEHDLADPILGLLPTIEEQGRLLLTSHKRDELSRGGEFETTLDATLLEDAVDGDWTRDPLQGLGAAILEHEYASYQAAGGVTDDNRVGLGQRLQPRSEIRRLADNRIRLAGSAGAELPCHDEAGVDADANLECVVAQRRDLLLHFGVETRQPCENLEGCTHPAHGIVLVRARIPEVDQEPVPEIASDLLVEVGDDLGADLPVGANHCA